MNEGESGNPGGLGNVVSLQPEELSEQKDTRTLSDLFATPVGDSSNLEGQSFFDSIGNAPTVDSFAGSVSQPFDDPFNAGQPTSGVQQVGHSSIESFQSTHTTQDLLGVSQGLVKPLIEPFAGLDISKEPQRTPSMPQTPEGEGIVHGKQTEAQRRCSAWIPPPQTQQLLATIASGMMNSLDVDQQFLTSPGITFEGPKVCTEWGRGEVGVGGG